MINDKYTDDYFNDMSKRKLGIADTMKVGVSPTRYAKYSKSKYKDANWLT